MWSEFLNLFRREPMIKSVEAELYAAQKAKLAAHTRLEYAQAEVAMQTNRVNRLGNVLAGLKDELK